ncbi:hypothetical protein ABR738_26005 [Streptomyces sp. Edi4]|uniref:hypothetical protein n=1 Tax=Streptomyces sp. Edi4 TaxID=3162527 RepID=UPI00330640CE
MKLRRTAAAPGMAAALVIAANPAVAEATAAEALKAQKTADDAAATALKGAAAAAGRKVPAAPALPAS